MVNLKQRSKRRPVKQALRIGGSRVLIRSNAQYERILQRKPVLDNASEGLSEQQLDGSLSFSQEGGSYGLFFTCIMV